MAGIDQQADTVLIGQLFGADEVAAANLVAAKP